MRNTINAICFIILVSSVAVQAGGKSAKCIDKIEKDKPIDNKLTITKIDKSVITVTRPIIDHSAKIIFFRSKSDFGFRETVIIRFDKNEKINYQKYSLERPVLKYLGFAIGAIGGAAVGNSIASDSQGFDIPIEPFLGLILGGVIGAALGLELSNSMNVKVSLDCF